MHLEHLWVTCSYLRRDDIDIWNVGRRYHLSSFRLATACSPLPYWHWLRTRQKWACDLAQTVASNQRQFFGSRIKLEMYRNRNQRGQTRQSWQSGGSNIGVNAGATDLKGYKHIFIHIAPDPSLLPSLGHYPNDPICRLSLPLWKQRYPIFQRLAPLRTWWNLKITSECWSALLMRAREEDSRYSQWTYFSGLIKLDQPVA